MMVYLLLVTYRFVSIFNDNSVRINVRDCNSPVVGETRTIGIIIQTIFIHRVVAAHDNVCASKYTKCNVISLALSKRAPRLFSRSVYTFCLKCHVKLGVVHQSVMIGF